MNGKESSGKRETVQRAAGCRTLAALCAGVFLGLWTSSAALRAADPPSVAIVKQIPVMEAKVVEVVKGLDATKLLAVDGKCELAKLTECKAMIAAGGPRDAGVPRSASQLDIL